MNEGINQEKIDPYCIVIMDDVGKLSNINIIKYQLDKTK